MISNPLADASLVNREQLEGFGGIEFPCEVSGIPIPTITWLYNGAMVQTGNGVVISEDGTLTIQEPLTSHSGIYQCTARNMFGEDRRDWILEVREPGIH